MWARRQEYLGLSDTLRVPATVRLALQGPGPPGWPPPPCPVSQFVLYQLGEEVTVVLNNLDCPVAIEMYVTAAEPAALRAAARKTVSAFFLDDEPLCGGDDDEPATEDESAVCLQVFDPAGAHMLTAIRAPAHDHEDALAVVDVCVCVRASPDGTRFEHVSTSRKPRRVQLA